MASYSRKRVDVVYLSSRKSYYHITPHTVCAYVKLPYPVRIVSGIRDFAMFPKPIAQIFKFGLYHPDWFTLDPPYRLLQAGYNVIFDSRAGQKYHMPYRILAEVITKRRTVFVHDIPKWYDEDFTRQQQASFIWTIGKLWRHKRRHTSTVERDNDYIYLRGRTLVLGKDESGKMWLPPLTPYLVSRAKYRKCFLAYAAEEEDLLSLNEAYMPIYQQTGMSLYVLTKFAKKDYDFCSLRVLTWKDHELDATPIKFVYTKRGLEIYFIMLSYKLRGTPITPELAPLLDDMRPNRPLLNRSPYIISGLLEFYDSILEKFGAI